MVTKLHLQAQQVALYTSSGKVSPFENSGASGVLPAAHSDNVSTVLMIAPHSVKLVAQMAFS